MQSEIKRDVAPKWLPAKHLVNRRRCRHHPDS
jgi:hypothetical protein